MVALLRRVLTMESQVEVEAMRSEIRIVLARSKTRDKEASLINNNKIRKAHNKVFPKSLINNSKAKESRNKMEKERIV